MHICCNMSLDIIWLNVNGFEQKWTGFGCNLVVASNNLVAIFKDIV